MTPQFGPIQLDTMAWTIDRSGIHAIPVAVLHELGVQAHRSGVSIAVTDVLVDSTAPPVARNRAFGFIAAALGRCSIVAPTEVTVAA